MRISEFHNELRRQGRVPVEKVGHNKGIRRAWRAARQVRLERRDDLFGPVDIEENDE